MIARQAIWCRRHWGTVIGLEDAGGPLPDVDNRAPSLVAWVGRRLEPSITAILAERTDKDASLAMVSVPVHLVFLGLERARAWERTWAVADHTGHRHAITLQVVEDSSTELSVLVGRRVVARMVPPWILARQAGVQMSPETDRAHRDDFYESLRNVIAASVARDEALA